MADNSINNSCTVGVLTTFNRNSNQYPQGKNARLLKELIIYGRKKGVFIFAFLPTGVDIKRKLIRGYTCKNDGRWIRTVFPWPDIVYNRILQRRIESRSGIEKILTAFEQDKNIFLFNSRFLNKWEVYKAISNYQQARDYLPETLIFNKENLRTATAKYSEVFLKPRNSSRGEGIIKIKSKGKGYTFARVRGKWVNTSTFDNLYQKLKMKKINAKRYLIQKGVELAQYHGQIFDLRTQVQKDGFGKWIITGIGVRVAAKQSFVTHVPNGGSIESYGRVMENVFGSDSRKSNISAQINELCLLIPLILEKELGIELGIMSMDLGVDSSGKVWLIEVNSKPGSFDEDHIRERHLNKLTDYFLFIGKVNKNKRNEIYESKHNLFAQ
jgi:hypothetical protein